MPARDADAIEAPGDEMPSGRACSSFDRENSWPPIYSHNATPKAHFPRQQQPAGLDAGHARWRRAIWRIGAPKSYRHAQAGRGKKMPLPNAMQMPPLARQRAAIFRDKYAPLSPLVTTSRARQHYTLLS